MTDRLYFDKYINHPIVRDRIKIYHVSKILDKLMNIKNPNCYIKNDTIFIKELDPEKKIQLHKHKRSIIDLTNKKFNEIWLENISSIRVW